MEFGSIVQTLAAGDRLFGHATKVGEGATGIGLVGWATTQNLVWLSGVVFGVATLVASVVWEWYRQKRRAEIEARYEEKRAWLDSEANKARLKAKLNSEGIDTNEWHAFDPSPDPDSEKD